MIGIYPNYISNKRWRWVGPLVVAFALALCASGVAPALAQCETTKLFGSDTGAQDRFGFPIGLDGHTLVIGAPGHSNNEWAGIAYIFKYDGWTWLEQAALTPDDLAPDDLFGESVAVSGNVVVVGAGEDDDNGEDSGSAYVFRYNGSGWQQEAKLLPDDGAAGDAFGQFVAIFGSTVLVGARADDDNGVDSGAAYVFRFTGSEWTQEAKLLASDGTQWAGFGFGVALWGDTALIGAPGDDVNEHNAGAAYVFRFDGSQWVQQAKLVASDLGEQDQFGCPVSIYGDLILVGANLDDVVGEDSGSAYVFRYDGSTWNEEAKLVPSDGDPLDRFAIGADIYGSTVVAGAWDDDDVAEGAGAAYVFRHDGTGWHEEAKLLASDGGYWDGLGAGVAVGPEHAVVGASFDSDNGQYSGSAYVFDLDVPGCAGDLDRDCDTDLADLSVMLAAWGCTGDGCPGDLNHDGDTGLADLSILLANFGCGE